MRCLMTFTKHCALVMNSNIIKGQSIFNLWQLVLTVNHYINRVLCNVCTNYCHAREGPLVSQFDFRKQQTGVCGHAHSVLVLITGAD